MATSHTFDASVVNDRLKKFWKLKSEFGVQQNTQKVLLNEIVSDRFCLVNGLQLLRDELQLAFNKGGDVMACSADLGVPSVLTTLAHTNCGDRINHARTSHDYDSMVGSRFASVSEDGHLKTELFSPAGGGTDDGNILAHVTVAHQIDSKIREKLYKGHPTSFILANFDLMTHVGYDISGESPYETLTFGKARESRFREARGACGAIIGVLSSYDEKNTVFRRLRSDIGEKNYAVLQNKIITLDGTDITYVVAAAIIAIQGLHNTAKGLTKELDERGVAHLTASITLNSSSNDELFYLARATVFQGTIKIQGLGLDASKYSGRVVDKNGKKTLLLIYDRKENVELEIETTTVETHHAPAHH